MLRAPVRSSLVGQTVAIVREQIQAGNWRGILPSERRLAEWLKISRPTLRLALKELIRQSVILPQPRSGYAISPRELIDRLETKTVHLLSPDPFERFRHQSHFWIAALQTALANEGFDLRIHHGEQYLRKTVGGILGELISHHPNGCWVLAHSTQPIQQWFAAKKIPAVIAGMPHAGIPLPCVLVDSEAACRHAVGILARARYPRVAILIEDTNRAGDLASIKGYEEGARDWKLPTSIIRYQAGRPDSLDKVINAFIKQRKEPTGLLIGTALAYATVLSLLLRAGIRIPHDVALICREEDNFLPFLRPAPSYYSFSADRYAARINEHVVKLLAGQTPPTQILRITPEFCPGASILRI